ncbi:DNA/RNA helicase domain-containing protein [Isoptericola sp. NPDC055881]
MSGTVRYSARALAELASSDISLVEKHLEEFFVNQGLGVPGPSEKRSWTRSLPVIARDLMDAGLGAVEILLEYRLPYTSRRADVVLAGVHPKRGGDSFVVVELKQWSRARTHDESENLVHVDGSPRREHLHPSVQVSGYVDFIRDFTATLHDERETIRGVAYLHNAHHADVADLVDATATATAPLFTSSSRGRWLDYLRANLAAESGAESADRLLRSAVRPSKQLLAVAAEEVRNREQFVLLDNQRIAFELVQSAVRKASKENTKTAVVVSGGPGSGKSVIALSLLGELAREGRTVLHATGSQSFTRTMRKVAGKGSSATQKLFMYFNSFMSAEKNDLDVLVLDEAHRIREKSVNRYTPKAIRERARPQVDELLDAARVPVFLLDEHQVVRPGESGTVETITAAAEAQGIQVRRVSLHDQFRAGGSEAYIEWVLRLLGLAEGGPVPWQGDDRFELRTAGSPRELEVALEHYLHEGFGARMTAGYAWRWSDPLADDALVPDVTVGGWSRPWNVKGERAVGDAPPSYLWATSPGGFGQVGCVYTAQGFEYDWNGVILGPDLVWRTDRWVARRDENRDPAFRSRKEVSDDQFDTLVRNVYKVLLTRGMKGTILHSVDPETQRLLEELMT